MIQSHFGIIYNQSIKYSCNSLSGPMSWDSLAQDPVIGSAGGIGKNKALRGRAGGQNQTNGGGGKMRGGNQNRNDNNNQMRGRDGSSRGGNNRGYQNNLQASRFGGDNDA